MNRSVSLCLAAMLTLFSLSAWAQRVGVVLSGGAAKGIAHVGVLKALEENDIPIDYVVGTSMGGIVAGCYAAGMSPDQIEALMRSDDLLRWISGKLPPGHNYFYSKYDPTPGFVRLNLALDSAFSVNLKSSIANDQSLNFAMAEKMAQPSAIANNNFDSLFVPLRVVASEIFTQQEVVLKSGSLADALRATQTVPFFYEPIRVNGKYLFDGGVYNNFPVDVAIREFNPDVIIGSNVSSKVYDQYPYGEDEKLIGNSLLLMLLDKSDPALIPENGTYIQPNLKGLTGFDFAKAGELIDSGYQATLRLIPEIKRKIAARRSCEELAARRNAFNARTTPLQVEELSMEGFTKNQSRYINRLFKNKKRPLFYSDVESGYYQLVSEDYFRNIYPGFSYSDSTKKFRFKLTRRPQHRFMVDFGGVIASRNVSNIYLGLNHFTFNSILTHLQADLNAGSFYKAAALKARIDFPYFTRFYLEPSAAFSNLNFLESTDLIAASQSSPTILDRFDRKVGVAIGLPVGKQFKATLGASYIHNTDRYSNYQVLVSSDTLDEMKLKGSRVGFQLSTNSLDRKQYPTMGKSLELSLDWFNLSESLVPGNTSALRFVTVPDKQRQWLRASLIMQHYFRKGFYSSGVYVHAVLSNQPVFNSYYGTIINAPGFYPIQDSRTLLLENFRSFNFVAGGWRNVFTIKRNLDFRLEGYLFKPFTAILRGASQEPVLDEEIKRIRFAGTAGLVLHTTVGPVSLSVNYYDEKKSQWGVLLHFGYLLFNRSAIE